MRKIFLLSLLFFSMDICAQSPIDSLFRVWSDESQNDTLRLNAMNELAYNPISGIRPDSLIKLGNEMKTMATAIGSKRYIVDANIHLLRAYLNTGNFEQASELSKEAYKDAVEADYLFGELRVRTLNGVLLAYMNQQIEGLEYLNEAYLDAVEFQNTNPNSSIFGEIRSYSLNKYVGDLQNMMGEINRGMGSNQLALENYEISMRSRLLDNDRLGVAASKNNIGLVYQQLEEYDKAMTYFEEALGVFEELNHVPFMGNALGNMASIFMEKEAYEKAEEYMFRNLEIQKKLGLLREGHAYLSLSNLFIDKKEFDKAKEFTDKAEKIFAPFGANVENTILKMYQGNIAMEEGDYTKAIALFQESSQFADEIKNLNLKANTLEYLYKVNKKTGNNRSALVYHEELFVLTDSLNKDETGKKLLEVELTNKFYADSLIQADEKRKGEVAYEKQILEQTNTRNVLIGSGLLLLVISGGLWNRLAFSRKSRKIIEIEKDRSENLLLNILPAEVAEELKAYGEAKARDFDLVTVIFTDFKEFTQTSEKLTATELVNELNHCFKGFDLIMEKFGIEKIKTIGDAYMAVGGLNEEPADSTVRTVLAGLEMQKFILDRKKERESMNQIPFEMRLGINSGPVVAGIVGIKKFQYDIWGDTVNTASRMESTGEVAKVNISKATYELIKDEPQFTFINRGKISVKGKNEIEMYFVEKD